MPKTTLENTAADTRPDVSKFCFLVISLGSWARGKTIVEAAAGCIRCGARRSDRVRVQLILGDSTAEVSRDGYIIRDAGSYNFDIEGTWTAGQLARKVKKTQAV